MTATNWWELEYQYDIGPAQYVDFVRPLYPPSDPDGPVQNGPDVEAYKRAVSRLGRWPWQKFDQEYSNPFALGQGDGWDQNTSGVRGVQRQAGVAKTSGNLGGRTADILLYARIPEGLPNAGEFAMDTTAVELLRKAAKQFPKADAPSPTPGAPLTRKKIASPNYSGRGGSSVRLIVLHTAEGARTIEELGNFFASPSAGVSSHTGADDTPNTIGEYVQRGNKAWTASNANSVAVQIELCAFAAWTTAEWNRHPTMIENAARWVAEEAAAFGIPITKLSPSAAQGSGRGVCQHNDLGAWGGGHWDCGSGFPIDRVIEMAKGA